MLKTNPRSRLLDAVYKNQSDTISKMAGELNENLIAEALNIACDYCSPDCVAVLLPLSSQVDIGDLLDKTMDAYDALPDDQAAVIDILAPLLADDQCNHYAARACEYGWLEAFPKIIDRVTGPLADELKIDWAAMHGNIDDVKKIAPQCDGPKLNRVLFLAAEHGQWDVARYVIPICSPSEVLFDMEVEQHNGHGNYTLTRERLKNVVEEVKAQQQRQRLLDNVKHSSVKKPSLRKI